MILHKHTRRKRTVTSPVISLPQSYRVIDCLLRAARTEKCPPSEMAELNFKTAENIAVMTVRLVPRFYRNFLMPSISQRDGGLSIT